MEALFRTYPFSFLRSYQETGNDLTFRRDLAVRAWCVRRGVRWIESVGSTVVRGMSAEQKRKVLSKGPRGRMEVLPVADHLCPPRDASIFSEPMEWNRICSFFPKMGKPWLSSSLQTINERSAWDVLGSFLKERGAGYSGRRFPDWHQYGHLPWPIGTYQWRDLPVGKAYKPQGQWIE